MMGAAVAVVISGCSPKSSTEESAAQNKALVEQAVAQAKKEMIAEQDAEKAKQEAAVATAKQELVAEQKAAAEKNRKSKSSSSHSTSTSSSSSTFHEPPPPPQRRAVCSNCGVVVAVTEVETAGKGSGLGVIAGGAVGGLLGHQVGKGTGKDLATIAGVVGGAVAGNAIEKNAKKIKSYDITVRMETGEERVFSQATPPSVANGDSVKIENDMVVKR